MQYSPKLKKAAQEIKEILRNHDIAGVVVLYTPGNTEFMLKLDPSFSCCEMSGEKLSMNSDLSKFGGDNELRIKTIVDTLDMVHGISTVLGKVALPLMDYSSAMDKNVKIKRGPDTFTSHVTQSN